MLLLIVRDIFDYHAVQETAKHCSSKLAPRHAAAHAAIHAHARMPKPHCHIVSTSYSNTFNQLYSNDVAIGEYIYIYIYKYM